MTAEQTVMGSRAVSRSIEPGESSICAECGERVKYQAKVKGRQVIANVYVDGRWDRTDHFHAACYQGQHGEPDAHLR